MESGHPLRPLEELFLHARSLTPHERAAYLDEACAGNTGLREQVEQLLAHHDRSGVLDEPIRVSPNGIEGTPERIGPYQILGVLGRGGMGIVYRARQEHPEREIAVKILRRGLDTPKLRRRFESESGVLARLQHPSIATVLSVGACEDGDSTRPYFAMELIDGVTLDRYLAQTNLPLGEKLALFLRICEGVLHAHQRGVIHRDLKPQNILVDRAGDPKILDFGVAHQTEHGSPDARQTLAGELIGTLAYMSPEQVDAAGDSVDTRSDVYALGVVLYEMLTGRLPYDLGDSSIAGVSKTIKEKPPRPISGSNRELRGDLNTVVLHALRKEPDQRYQSVSGMIADIQRYIRHEPISARPATMWYIARRFARRRRGLVSAAAMLLISIAAGLTIILWQSSRVAAESEIRNDVALFLKEMLTSLDPEKTAGEELTVRSMLDDASGRLQKRFMSAPGVRGELHSTVGQTYHNLGEFGEARRQLGLAIDDLSAGYGPRDDRTIEAMAALGYTLRELGELDEAERILLDARSRLASEDGPIAAIVRMNLVTVLDSQDRDEEAVELSREGYRRSLETNGADHDDTLMAQSNLGAMLINLRRLDEAIPLLEDALGRRRSKFGDDNPKTIGVISNLGTAYTFHGESERALPLVLEAAERSTRVLGPTHLRTLRRRVNIVRHYLATGDFSSAAQTATVLANDLRDLLEPDNPELLSAIELTVTAYAFNGDIEGARKVAIDAYEQISAIRGPLHPATGRAAYLLYNLYDEIGDQEQAEYWLQETNRSRYTP